MNIDGIVESFYPKDEIKRLNRIGKAEKIGWIIILNDEKNPLIHKNLMCKKTSEIALLTDNKGWESFEILGTSAVNMNVKTSTGEYFYFSRELSQFIQYVDNHATGFTSVTVNSLDSVSLAFSNGKDLTFVDYKCKAIE